MWANAGATRTVNNSERTGEQEMRWRYKRGREGQIDEITDALDIVLESSKSLVEIDSPSFGARKHNIQLVFVTGPTDVDHMGNGCPKLLVQVIGQTELRLRNCSLEEDDLR